MSLSIDSTNVRRKLFPVVLAAAIVGVLLTHGAGPAGASGPDGTLMGDVTDSVTDAPIAGAIVRLESAYGLPWVFELPTDALGHYEASVPPQRYNVLVVHPDYRFYRATVGVGSLKTVWANASLDPAAPRDAIVKGTITDSSTGDPVATGRVVAAPGGSGPGTYVNVSTPDSFGRYELWLVPGDYNLFTDGVAGYVGFATFVSLAPGEVRVLDITLDPNPLDASISGTVVDGSTSSPLAGASVLVGYDDGVRLGPATTDASGTYAIPVPSGAATVTADLLGYAPSTSFGVSVPPMSTVTVDFTLWPIRGFIEGVVHNGDTGLPIENATVAVSSAEGFYDDAATDASGQYSIAVSRGSYGVEVSAAGFFPSSLTVSVADGEMRVLDVSLDPLPPIVATIQGYVVDASDGAHVPDMTVSVFDPTTGFSNVTISDPSGFYSVGFPETFVFAASVVPDAGYAGGSAYGSTSPGETVWRNITIYPLNATLRFRVTNAITDSPISGASVSIGWGPYSSENTTDATGVADVLSPATRDVSVAASGAGYLGFIDTITVAPGLNALNVELWPDLPHDVLVQGYVTEAGTGTPTAGALVQATGYDGVVVAASTDGTGYYSAPTVAWPQQVRATAAGYAPDAASIAPSSGEVLWVNLSLEPDPVPPEFLSFTATPDASVSPNNPTSLVATILDQAVETGLLYRLRRMSVAGDNATYLLMGTSEVTIAAAGADLWSASATWDARETGGWLGNASGSEWWPALVGFPGSYAILGEWQNSTATDLAAAFFDGETGDLVALSRFTYGPLALYAEPSSTFRPSGSGLNLSATTGRVLGPVSVNGTARELLGLRFVYEDLVPTGRYGAFLRVTDAGGNTNGSAVTFQVDNTPPVADAGPDQAVIEGELVTFDGSGSRDDSGTVESYTWTFVDGAARTLSGVSPTYRFLTPGTYTVTLAARDAAGNEATDAVVITVGPDGVAPTANAGLDQTVDEDVVVTFDGSGSTDDVFILKYTWTFVDAIPQTLTGVSPTYVFATPGTYTVTLTIEDAGGNADADAMVVTVRDTTPPTANAGPDRTVNEDFPLPLNGAASTDNVGVANYTWTFVDGTPQTLYGVSTSYVFATPGTYDVTLTVRDAAGNSAVDTLLVTVLDATPPTANAGLDQTVDEDALVTFDGSGTADNVGVVNYTWTFMDGTPRIRYGISPTYTFATPGTYVVTLSARDAAGNIGTDTVTVTVRDITSPVANAGRDQTVDEDNVVTFDGRGSTDNAGVVNFTWTFTDGVPRAVYGVTPTYTFLTPGTYEVTLTVRDAAGHAATDLVVVTVQDATNPTVSVVAPSSGATVSGTIDVTTNASDNVGIVRVELRVDGTLVATSTAAPFGFSLNTANYPDGTRTIRVTAYDAAGNSASVDVTVTVSNAAPPAGGLGDLALYGGLASAAILAAIGIAILMMRRRKKPAATEEDAESPSEHSESEEGGSEGL